jgi:hypothetical protein
MKDEEVIGRGRRPDSLREPKCERLKEYEDRQTGFPKP